MPRNVCTNPKTGRLQERPEKHQKEKDGGDRTKQQVHKIRVSLFVTKTDAVQGDKPGYGQEHHIDKGLVLTGEFKHDRDVNLSWRRWQHARLLRDT